MYIHNLMITATNNSDNGLQFASNQFAQFLKQNGIKLSTLGVPHTTPSTNELSEQFIPKH